MNSPVTNAATASNGQVVVFPPEPGIGVLAVVPPYPVGYKPQSDGALGINIAMVYGNRGGLLVYILTYLNMDLGDIISVFIDTKNAPVAEFPVTDAHFNDQGIAKNIPFYISAKAMEAKFLKSENKDFWFTVKRLSDNSTDGSPPVQLFYKKPAPGEADTDAGKEFNQGLKLPVPSETIIDQTVIDEGMFVTVLAYFNQQIGDVVELAFGTIILELTVIALGDIVFELTPEILAKLPPGNTVIIRWQAFDAVENSSGWSGAVTIPLKLGIVLLAAPIIEEADADNVVNHDGLAGGPMNILVTGVFAAKDLIELKLVGITRGGDTVTHTFSMTLTAATRKVSFSVLNEWVRNLIRGALRACYTVTKAGKTQNSKPADATFTGTSQPLGLPIVQPLVNNKLPVDTAMATVQVAKYWPLKKGAIVKLYWQTTDQDGIKALFIFQQIITDPTQPVIFQVPAKYIAPYASTPLTVQCTVTNPGEVEVFSELLQLMFGDAALDLKPPILVAPAKTPIDVLTYTNAVTVQTEYLKAALNDQALLIIENPDVVDKPFPARPFNQNKRANFNLTPALLLSWMGRGVKLSWQLIRNGKPVGKSLPLVLTVNKIANGDARLKAGIIDQADSARVVDTNEFKGDATVSHKNWLLRGGGYSIDITAIGTAANGSAIVTPIDKGRALTLAEEQNGFSSTLQRAKLLLLKDSSNLHIKTEVHFNGSTSWTLIFPASLTYIIRNKPPILSENFDNEYSRVISAGGSISIPSMNIRHISGLGQLGIQSLNAILTGPYAPIYNQSAGQVLVMHSDAYGYGQHMRLEFRHGYSSVSFYYRFVQSNGVLVRFLDKNGNSLSNQYLVNNFGSQYMSFSTSSNAIWFMEIITSAWDLFILDYFHLGRK